MFRSGKAKKKKASGKKVTMFEAKDIVDDHKMVENYDTLEMALAEMKLLMDQTIKIVKRPMHKVGMCFVCQASAMIFSVTRCAKLHEHAQQDLSFYQVMATRTAGVVYIIGIVQL